MPKQPFAYRLQWASNSGFVFYIPEDFERAINTESANIWGLFEEPQSGCSNEVVVYYKGGWVQPKYVHSQDMSQHTPLYLGQILHTAAYKPEHFRCNQKYLH